MSWGSFDYVRPSDGKVITRTILRTERDEQYDTETGERLAEKPSLFNVGRVQGAGLSRPKNALRKGKR